MNIIGNENGQTVYLTVIFNWFCTFVLHPSVHHRRIGVLFINFCILSFHFISMFVLSVAPIESIGHFIHIFIFASFFFFSQTNLSVWIWKTNLFLAENGRTSFWYSAQSRSNSILIYNQSFHIEKRSVPQTNLCLRWAVHPHTRSSFYARWKR